MEIRNNKQVLRASEMTKLFYVVAMVVLVAILACGGEDGTEAPTGTSAQQATVVGTTTPESTATPLPTPTPEPTATPVPTPMPEPTLTPVPAPTEAPAVMTGMGAITPLLLDDPLAIAGELSEAELACAAGVADLSRLLQIFSAPEHASPEELTQLIGCLEDETVLRLFVTTIVGLEDPLSKETSECVRAGMEGIDARAVMLSGMAGDAQAAMMGSMATFLTILTCLSDDEFAVAAPRLGVPVEDREGLLCLVDELDGPAAFAAAISGQDEQAMLALFGAAITVADWRWRVAPGWDPLPLQPRPPRGLRNRDPERRPAPRWTLLPACWRECPLMRSHASRGPESALKCCRIPPAMDSASPGAAGPGPWLLRGCHLNEPFPERAGGRPQPAQRGNFNACIQEADGGDRPAGSDDGRIDRG